MLSADSVDGGTWLLAVKARAAIRVPLIGGSARSDKPDPPSARTDGYTIFHPAVLSLPLNQVCRILQ